MEQPESELGYPWSQVKRILGSAVRVEQFSDWMFGQTMGVDPVTSEGVVYADDLERWIRGERLIYD